MGESDKETGSKLAEKDAEELMKDAAEGLRQVPGSRRIPPDATTVPGIPIDRLNSISRQATQKIPVPSRGAEEYDELCEAETIPPTEPVFPADDPDSDDPDSEDPDSEDPDPDDADSDGQPSAPLTSERLPEVRRAPPDAETVNSRPPVGPVTPEQRDHAADENKDG